MTPCRTTCVHLTSFTGREGQSPLSSSFLFPAAAKLEKQLSYTFLYKPVAPQSPLILQLACCCESLWESEEQSGHSRAWRFTFSVIDVQRERSWMKGSSQPCLPHTEQGASEPWWGEVGTQTASYL